MHSWHDLPRPARLRGRSREWLNILIARPEYLHIPPERMYQTDRGEIRTSNIGSTLEKSAHGFGIQSTRYYQSQVSCAYAYHPRYASLPAFGISHSFCIPQSAYCCCFRSSFGRYGPKMWGSRRVASAFPLFQSSRSCPLVLIPDLPPPTFTLTLNVVALEHLHSDYIDFISTIILSIHITFTQHQHLDRTCSLARNAKPLAQPVTTTVSPPLS